MSTGDLLVRVRDRLAAQGEISADSVAAVVREEGAVLGAQAMAELACRVRAELLGAGPLESWLTDPAVTDVLVNGPDDVWVDRGEGLERVSVPLGDAAAVRSFAVRMAAAGGQRLDDASPIVDARLPDGTRLHAVLAPLAGPCTVISLRTLRTKAFTLEELTVSGSVPASLAPVLRGLVAARANLLVTGATGTGKTTLLASLLSLVHPSERIVCIEEAGELAPDHPHVVHLLARRANVEGAGGVGLDVLVRAALRMRPDRIVLGEARGAEIREVLTALNTGHEGGCATLHANTAADVPARLDALGALAGMDRASVAAQAVSAFDAVLHLRRDSGRRRLAQVGVVARDGTSELVVVPALEISVDGTVSTGPAWGRLAERMGWES